MSKKLRCTVTGRIIYMTEKRYAAMLAKYEDEEKLKASYISLLGKKIKDGSVEDPVYYHNRIQCRLTGLSCYISTERINAGIQKYGSWEAFRDQYICRTAAKLLREGKTEDQIKEMVQDGTFPIK